MSDTKSRADQILAAAAAAYAESTAAEIQLLRIALRYADLNATPDPPPGKGKMTVVGGEGCPALPEACVREFDAHMESGDEHASSYLGEALALRHRFPKTFARVLAGDVPARQARELARACLALTLPAAGTIDEEVHLRLETIDSQELSRLISSARTRAGLSSAA
ncbi:hypothetical protein [Kribbella deserti]|uniref:DUF222 domain-containing protein n=1 Tax=Kribbella deserti TaxID=1926257 RepID=A0ABV6QUL2_9ACTN